MRIFLVFLLFSFYSFAEKQTSFYTNSIGVNISYNGILDNPSSYSLSKFPISFSYAHEVYDSSKINIAFEFAYDSIYTTVVDAVFLNRVAPKFNFGYKAFNFLFYGTLGYGFAFFDNISSQASPVCGAGIFRSISERFALSLEANVQNVHHYGVYYPIMNASIGIVYNI